MIEVSTLAALKAASITDVTAHLSAAALKGLFFWTVGDFTGRNDDVNVVKSNGTDIDDGAWVRQSADQVSFRHDGGGAVPRPVGDRLRDSLSLADFGFAGDSNSEGTTGTDDSDVWRDAIAAALAQGIGTIRVPHGVTGYSRIDSAVITAVPPQAIRFVNDGQGPGHRYERIGPMVVWTGAGACFDFLIEEGDYNNYGGYAFRDLGFRATHAEGTMFAFNRELVITLENGGSYGDRGNVYGVGFYNCTFYGAEIDTEVNDGDGKPIFAAGTAIHGRNIFQLLVDDQCFFRGWKRAVDLDPADNSVVRGIYFLNGRHIHASHEQTSGNDNKLEPAYVTGTRNYGEDRYCIYDAAYGTEIKGVSMECYLDTDPGQKAALYLNGRATVISSCGTGGALPWAHIGPDADDIVIHEPISGVFCPDFVVDDPVSTDFGYLPERYQVTLVRPNRYLAESISPHPRIRVIDPAKEARTWSKWRREDNVFLDGNGYRQRRFLIDALNYNGQSYAFAASPPDFVEDATACVNGWAIRLPAGTTPGFAQSLYVGRHVAVGDTLRITVRSRVTASLAAGYYDLYVYAPDYTPPLDGVRLHGVGGPASGYANTVMMYDLATASDGDEIRLLFQGGTSTSADLHIEAIMVEVVSAAIPAAGLAAALTPASTAHSLNSVFNDTEVEAALDQVGGRVNALVASNQQLETKLNGALAALARFGMVA